MAQTKLCEKGGEIKNIEYRGLLAWSSYNAFSMLWLVCRRKPYITMPLCAWLLRPNTVWHRTDIDVSQGYTLLK